MRCEQILAMDGNTIQTISGAKYAIGNAPHNLGDWVWTSNEAVFGTVRIPQIVGKAQVTGKGLFWLFMFADGSGYSYGLAHMPNINDPTTVEEIRGIPLPEINYDYQAYVGHAFDGLRQAVFVTSEPSLGDNSLTVEDPVDGSAVLIPFNTNRPRVLSQAVVGGQPMAMVQYDDNGVTSNLGMVVTSGGSVVHNSTSIDGSWGDVVYAKAEAGYSGIINAIVDVPGFAEGFGGPGAFYELTSLFRTDISSDISCAFITPDGTWFYIMVLFASVWQNIVIYAGACAGFTPGQYMETLNGPKVGADLRLLVTNPGAVSALPDTAFINLMEYGYSQDEYGNLINSGVTVAKTPGGMTINHIYSDSGDFIIAEANASFNYQIIAISKKNGTVTTVHQKGNAPYLTLGSAEIDDNIIAGYIRKLPGNE